MLGAGSPDQFFQFPHFLGWPGPAGPASLVTKHGQVKPGSCDPIPRSYLPHLGCTTVRGPGESLPCAGRHYLQKLQYFSNQSPRGRPWSFSHSISDGHRKLPSYKPTEEEHSCSVLALGNKSWKGFSCSLSYWEGWSQNVL